MAEAAADRANQQMVDRLIADGALWSRPLIAAFRATPRHRFLERVFQYQRKYERWREIITTDLGPDDIRILYSDRALITRLSTSRGGPAVPISSSSQPSLMAQMLEELKLAPDLRVLEIGAGTGYNAALIAHVVGRTMVTTVDVDRSVLADAWDHLRHFPDRGVELHHADGRSGCAAGAPFDRIMVTAATPDLEPAWLEQLDGKGLLQAPLALAPGLAFIVRGAVSEGVFHGRLTRPAYFMPLRAEDESGPTDLQAIPAVNELRALGAPWAGWFDRKGARLNWLAFSQAIAFYGLLRGLGVHYRALESGQPVFGVSSGEALCWLGPQELQVSGAAGRDLGLGLWGAFMEAGGPRPTEFRVRASPRGGLTVTRPESYVRDGPRCQRLWELIEPRDRPVALW